MHVLRLGKHFSQILPDSSGLQVFAECHGKQQEEVLKRVVIPADADPEPELISELVEELHSQRSLPIAGGGSDQDQPLVFVGSDLL